MVQFFEREGKFVLRVSRSSQALVAAHWLEQRWGIAVKFRKTKYWYQADLPGFIPARLVALLNWRSQQRRQTGWGYF